MAEKGGKGFSVPDKASLKGKDDSSAKSKRGRKVQFNTEGSPEALFNFSPKFGGKGDNKTSKSDRSKGGKGDKVTNGGKIPVAKEAQPLELRIEQELPKDVQCLMDCEAKQILGGIQDQMTVLSRDPSIKIPVSFDKGLQYCQASSQYTTPSAVRQVLETLSKYGVSGGEICVIGNICPETLDEVFAFVPSLKPKRSRLTEPLKDVLSELAKLKKST